MANRIKDGSAGRAWRPSSQTVLVVEPDGELAEQATRVLESIGCRITATAPTGALAARLALTCRFDLIIADVELHGELDGIERATLIRERSLIPILFAVDHRSDAALARASTIQNCGFILKPVSPRALRGAAVAALSLGSYARTTVPPHPVSMLAAALETLRPSSVDAAPSTLADAG